MAADRVSYDPSRWPTTHSGDLWHVLVTYDPCLWPMTHMGDLWPVPVTWWPMTHPGDLQLIGCRMTCPGRWPTTHPCDLWPLTWCLSVAKSTVARWNLQSGLRPSIVIALSRVLRASSERFRACCTWPRFNIKHSTTWSISTSQLQVPTIDPGAFWDWRWWAPMHTSHLADKAKVNADYIVSSSWRLNCIFWILLDRQITAF